MTMSPNMEYTLGGERKTSNNRVHRILCGEISYHSYFVFQIKTLTSCGSCVNMLVTSETKMEKITWS